VASARRKRNGAAGELGAPASVTLLMALPEDALLNGELELIQAHFAGLIDQVFAPEVDSDPHQGDDTPWP
jgi:hypothetical protein